MCGQSEIIWPAQFDNLDVPEERGKEGEVGEGEVRECRTCRGKGEGGEEGKRKVRECGTCRG